jgi:hypothetical protein
MFDGTSAGFLDFATELKEQVLTACTAIATDLGSLGVVNGMTVDEQLQQTCAFATNGINAFVGMTTLSVTPEAVDCSLDMAAEATCLEACGSEPPCPAICEAQGWIDGDCETLNVSVMTPDATLSMTLSTNLPLILVAIEQTQLSLLSATALADALVGPAAFPEECDLVMAGDNIGVAVECLESVSAASVAVIDAANVN